MLSTGQARIVDEVAVSDVRQAYFAHLPVPHEQITGQAHARQRGELLLPRQAADRVPAWRVTKPDFESRQQPVQARPRASAGSTPQPSWLPDPPITGQRCHHLLFCPCCRWSSAVPGGQVHVAVQAPEQVRRRLTAAIHPSQHRVGLIRRPPEPVQIVPDHLHRVRVGV